MFKKKFPSLSSLGSDGNTSFLRAARAGHLDKVLDHLKNNVDINTSNANGLNALHLASKDGHLEVVTELLKRGANVDSATKKGNTALHIASLAGQEDVVRLLVETGASVNVQSQNGFTPLYMAAQENHDNVVKFLLSNGANQSLATEDGFTPLAVAMQQGHDKVVAVLLENDTRGKVRLPALHIAAKKDDCKAAALLLQNEHNPDVTSKSGFTPLHIASHYGNQGIANLLLNKGADVNYSAKHNITPLHVAAKWGKSNMVGLLLEKGANIESKTRDGLTPLHCAARSGHEQVVDMLLERGAPISCKTKNGLAPLHMSSQGDHVDAARILLYHRAPVDEVTVDYLTALHVAAHCGHVRVAKLLLDRKADSNARALNGFTPLHIACKKNRIKVVELLLKHGASIEATTESGLTPLHVASFMGCMNIVIYLLQNEANPDVPTVRGETPLHLAARANQTDIIRILLRNGAQVDARARELQTPLHIAARLGNVDIVMLLLQHGAVVDSTTKDLYTALHIAAKEGQDEVAQVLLENGASPTATTKKGFTPLHLASKYGNMKVASLLLQRDAPVDAQGKNGVTPLHVASHYDHQNVALLLLDKGASPHATAKNGHTSLHIAAKKNQMDIATTLLEYGAKADIESKAGFTPLHLSAQEGHIDMTSLLIDHEANSNHKAKNGLTPLHLCAQEDRVNVATVLVKNGAEVDAKTKAGYTPLHVASHFGQLNMIRFLIDEGAKVSATTSVGYTPLHQAAQQGHSTIVNTLLASGAPPNTTTNQGQTALSIAQKLGYIGVVETLKGVTEPINIIPTNIDEKYKVVSPETMQETFMSDSEDEGGEDTLLSEQPYRYLTVDEMKSLGDDSLPIDVTRDERGDSHRECMTAPPAAIDDTISPQHLKEAYTQFGTPDNIDIGRHPLHIGFLVSFLVDARGGAMRGCRHSGVRVIVPPRRASQPMRVTCRYLKKDKLNHPPPLMEGEALASRILELGPVGAKFLGPVMIEVPHFGSLRGKEREIVILRSDNGETWREHTFDPNEDAVQDILNHSFDKEEITNLDDTGRTTRILTTDFPHYFAVVTRVRQEVHAIGPEGGMVSSSVVPQVQAVFPQGALTKKIKVGLQAQPISTELAAKLLGNRVAVSPIVTVEPRRRKFHKPITLTIPKPQAANKGMLNQYSGDAPTLRLLCSITGGTTRAQWEDVTGSTPFTFVNDCVSFTTTVSARFWLMDCRNVVDATKMATELYKEAIHVPFMAKFVVFAKRVGELEARLRVFCMTDDKEDKTLEHQEHFTEVAKSRDVEVLEGKLQYVEFAGNLIPVTKSGEQLQLGFRAFRENRLPFTVRVKDPHADTIGRTLFMREAKVSKGEAPQQPICILNIVLPDEIIPETGVVENDLNKYNYIKDSRDLNCYQQAELRLSDISNLLGKDWVNLAEELNISTSDINKIKTDYVNSDAKQGLSMLRLWLQKAGNKAQANVLETALSKVGRDDIIQECIFNTTNQTGFDLLKQELRPSKDHNLKYNYRVDNIYSDQDIMKDSESIEELSRLSLRKTGELTEKDDKEETKYIGEEKEIEEKKMSVSERRKEIELRISQDKEKSVEKQLTKVVDVDDLVLIHKQNKVEHLTEKEISEEKLFSLEEKEPSDLTFEEKRLSFEQGKRLIEMKPDKKKLNTQKDVEIYPSEQINKTEAQLDSFHEITTSMGQALDQQTEDTHKDVLRRNSELFEGVSQGLVGLEKTCTPQQQDLLSPKVSKTPPPSPAEFKETTGSTWKVEEDVPLAEKIVEDWSVTKKPESIIDAEKLGKSKDKDSFTLKTVQTGLAAKIENGCNNLKEDFVGTIYFEQYPSKTLQTETSKINDEIDRLKKEVEYKSTNIHDGKPNEKSFVGKVSKKIFGVFKKNDSLKTRANVKDEIKEKYLQPNQKEKLEEIVTYVANDDIKETNISSNSKSIDLCEDNKEIVDAQMNFSTIENITKNNGLSDNTVFIANEKDCLINTTTMQMPKSDEKIRSNLETKTDIILDDVVEQTTLFKEDLVNSVKNEVDTLVQNEKLLLKDDMFENPPEAIKNNQTITIIQGMPTNKTLFEIKNIENVKISPLSLEVKNIVSDSSPSVEDMNHKLKVNNLTKHDDCSVRNYVQTPITEFMNESVSNDLKQEKHDNISTLHHNKNGESESNNFSSNTGSQNDKSKLQNESMQENYKLKMLTANSTGEINEGITHNIEKTKTEVEQNDLAMLRTITGRNDSISLENENKIAQMEDFPNIKFVETVDKNVNQNENTFKIHLIEEEIICSSQDHKITGDDTINFIQDNKEDKNLHFINNDQRKNQNIDDIILDPNKLDLKKTENIQVVNVATEYLKETEASNNTKSINIIKTNISDNSTENFPLLNNQDKKCLNMNLAALNCNVNKVLGPKIEDANISEVKETTKYIVDDTSKNLSSIFPKGSNNDDNLLRTYSFENMTADTGVCATELNRTSSRREDEKFTNMLLDMLIEQESIKNYGDNQASTSNEFFKLPVNCIQNNTDVTEQWIHQPDNSCLSKNEKENQIEQQESDQFKGYKVPYVTTPTLQRRGLGGSQRLSREERPILRDVSHLVSESSSDEEEHGYIVTEPLEKSPQNHRKVTFTFDSEEDGNFQTLSDNNSEVDFEEISQTTNTKNKTVCDISQDEKLKFEVKDNKQINQIEKIFEHIASETLATTDSNVVPVIEHEFQRMASQLSNEEVEECVTVWEDGGLTLSSEWDSRDKTSGNLQYDLEKLKEVSRNPLKIRDELINVDGSNVNVPSSMFWAFENIPSQHSVIEPDDLDIPIKTNGKVLETLCLTDRKILMIENSSDMTLKLNKSDSNSNCRHLSPLFIVSARQPCNLMDSPLGQNIPFSVSPIAKDDSMDDEMMKLSQGTTGVSGPREGEENLSELASGYHDTLSDESDTEKKSSSIKKD